MVCVLRVVYLSEASPARCRGFLEGQAGQWEPADCAPVGCGGVDAERESEGFSGYKVNGQMFEY